LDVDVRLFPLVLTPRQVAEYCLPRTPIKESERRRAGFEVRHGEGATELDALEALRPGELERILTSAILRYYDNGLNDRVSAAIGELARDVEVVRRDVLSTHIVEISELRRRYEAIRAEFANRVADYNRDLGVLWETITEDLQAQTPDLDEYPIPTGREAAELGEGLYNSQRDYLEQIEVYKQFQGK
jgi:hypothetical protein